MVFTKDGYIETPDDDPAIVYQDIVIAIAPDKGLNNGQPSLHAKCLAAAAPKAGEQVLHVGAGTGYYTAILSEIVRPDGQVVAMELDPELSRAAATNLASYENIRVLNRSALEPPLPSSDVIYVCAGASEPPDIWLDALNPQGRLIFPLTPGVEFGGMLMLTRTSDGFAASFICAAGFVPCVGGQREGTIGKLAEAYQRGDWSKVRWLHRDKPVDDALCWLSGDTWWLSK
jgi:protein-L-isoaspartate(D-aspartate) O-methyltransferase